MKVIHIFQDDVETRFGGQVIIWKNLFQKMSNSDVNHYVLDYVRNEMVPAKEYFDFQYPNKQIQSTKLVRFFSVFKLIRSLFKFRKDIDVIHLHIIVWAGLISVISARIYKIPIVFESVLLDSDTPGGVLNTKFGRIKIFLIKKINKIITISGALEDDYLNHNFDNRKLVTIMNPVDPDIFSSITNNEKDTMKDHLGFSKGDLILLFVGSIKDRKGVSDLVDSFIELSRNISNLKLVLIGPCSLEDNPSIDITYVKNLKDKILSANLNNRCVFTGLLDDKFLLADYYRVADIFVFPSLKEGLGNVILEAMSTSLPIIVTDLPVLKDIVLHDFNGLLVPINSPKSITCSVERLISDDYLVNYISKNAKTTVLDNHSIVRWETDLNNLYFELKQ